MLSRLVHDHRIKVTLTGEGADEIFLGYNLFKETKIRQFWARHPESPLRPKLLQKLYPFLRLNKQGPDLLRRIYGVGLDDPSTALFSHLVRFNATGRISRFFSEDFASEVSAEAPIETLFRSLPEAVKGWRPLARAQYIEMQTLLVNYLLSAQGDRMLMSNSVEGRFPFLDHRIIELAATMPDALKLAVLDEKHVVKRIARGKIPRSILSRSKQPYRAPIARALSSPPLPDWVGELLCPEAVGAFGIFNQKLVPKLTEKMKTKGDEASEADNMAFIAVATTQLLVSRFSAPEKIPEVHLARVEVRS